MIVIYNFWVIYYLLTSVNECSLLYSKLYRGTIIILPAVNVHCFFKKKLTCYFMCVKRYILVGCVLCVVFVAIESEAVHG